MKKNIYNRITLWITTGILIGIELYALTTDSHYKWDFIFLIGLLWVLYYIRERIKLHPLHFVLFAIFLLLHNFGVFGFYSMDVLGIEYDFWVHTYFGIVSGLILYRTYRLIGPYHNWIMYIAIIALVLGFSAFHELFEYAGAMVVGEGEGVLFVGAGDIDEWDTQKDMRNNLFGGIIALGLYLIYLWFISRKELKKKKWSDIFFGR